MAEHTKDETKELASIFLSSYNSTNKTNFSWDDKKSYQPQEPYDFMAFDGNKTLGVQLVRATETEDRDYIRPKRVERVIENLKKEYQDNKMSGFSIYINFHNPPAKEEQAKALAFWLCYITQQKITDSLGRLSYYRYNARFDKEYIGKIEEYVSELSILPTETKEEMYIAFSSSKLEIEALVDDQQRVVNAVKKKQKKYKDVLLVVDSNSMPIHDIYIPWISEELKEIEIKEVWIVDNFVSLRRATRVR